MGVLQQKSFSTVAVLPEQSSVDKCLIVRSNKLHRGEWVLKFVLYEEQYNSNLNREIFHLTTIKLQGIIS